MTNFKEYTDYIRNTGMVPLPIEIFDDDWDPIGNLMRRDMVKANLITVEQDGIRLVESIHD